MTRYCLGLMAIIGISASAAEIRTDALCGLFVDGQTPTFKVTAAEGSTWKASDWRGNKIGEGEVKSETLTPPAPDRGYYLLVVTEPDGETASHSYFIVPDPKTRKMDQQSFYSMDSAFTGCSHAGRFDCPWLGGNTYRMIAELHRYAGIPHTRERMEWKRAQPKPNMKPDFKTRLRNDKMLKECGVSVSGMYQNGPKWAGAKYSIASDLLATYRFSEACAREFGDSVEDWEFDNEEDGGHTPEPAWEYASAFKAASLGFHAGRKDVLVLQGAFCKQECSAYDEMMFANDIGKYLDVFNYHCYAPISRYPTVLGDLRDFLDKNDRPGRAVWMTESGSTLEGHCDIESKRKGHKQHSPEQERLVAEYYAKAQVVLQMEGIMRNYFFIFSAYTERGGVKDWGVLRFDGTLKPIFAAISTITDELGSSPLVGEVAIGRDAKGYLFRNPDGSQTLMAWKKSRVDTATAETKDYSAPKATYRVGVPSGDYCVVDMCGAKSSVHADDRGLALVLDRYPVYVRNVNGLKVCKAARAPGNIGPVPSADEDLTVVLQAIHNRNDFAAGSGQASLLIENEKGGMTIKAWNLSDTPKTGRLMVEGATLLGLENEISIPAFGKVDVPVTFVNDDAHMRNPNGTKMVLGGEFNGKRISKTALTIVDTMRAVRDSRKIVLAADDPANWQRNTSAEDYSCERNVEDGGIKVKCGWKSSFSNRWIYPRYVLQEGESAENATVIEFEVRSKQNKVENDYSLSVFMLGFDGTDKGDWLKFEHPTEVWEKRRFNLAPVLAANKGKKLTSFRIGGNPRGTVVDYYIRNINLYVAKPEGDDAASGK